MWTDGGTSIWTAKKISAPPEEGLSPSKFHLGGRVRRVLRDAISTSPTAPRDERGSAWSRGLGRPGRGPRTLLPLLLLAACGQAPAASQPAFPAASRPVAAIVSPRFSTEPERDSARAATLVMDRAGTQAGMRVADVGAGEGYYTVRLAKRVGPGGRVVAEDIIPAVRDALAQRIAQEKIANVDVALGEAADPKLAAAGFDQIYLVHMYHEISSPYEFLWRLRPALKAGGRLVIVDADRPTGSHGTPPKLLDCELAAVGYTLVRRDTIAAVDAYVALYEAKGARPEPGAIRACRG